jgi:hypothetical protein
MICIQCGAQNDDALSYCRQCGTNLQAVRSALLAPPPAPSVPAVSAKYAPLMAIFSALFGFLSFGALFGTIIAIIAIGADPSARLDVPAVVILSVIVAVTGTVGIVSVIRMLLKMVTASAAAVQQSTADAPSRPLPGAQQNAALPPPRQPVSVVEHTTAHLPNYVSPRRDTGEMG